PLYWVQDEPEQDRRTLCMPYFGSLTLAGLLQALKGTPPGRRSGQQVLDALDRARAAAPVSLPARGPARPLLLRATFAQAVCWMGACLADALQYAHERGLLPLDLNPSTVLLAVDGQPMLLDFHLAREPIRPGGAPPRGLGGTPTFMSPEQRRVLKELVEGRPGPGAGDSRSGVYSLGVLLYHALGGEGPPQGPPPALGRGNAPESAPPARGLRQSL